MDIFEKKESASTDYRESTNADNVVDIAIARMKSGSVVKEERKRKYLFVIFGALAITLLATLSTFDSVYQTPDSETKANGDIVIELQIGQSGHYFATGKINGEPVKFIVDTGASNVAIPMNVAKRLGLPLGLKRSTLTANGIGTAYETAIKSIELGDIKLTDVEASVTEGLPGEEALLGMSFLRRTKVEHEKGVMTITY